MEEDARDDEANNSALCESCNAGEDCILEGDAPSSSRSGCSPNGWFQGHSFVKKHFHKPATCHHCSDLLWGLLGTTGMICETCPFYFFFSVCNFLAHEKCLSLIVSPCTCIVPFLVQDAVSHCWSDIGHFKRKFCNVCRKRLDDLLAVRCEICEYYAHYECLDFVAADCKQCAVSTPMFDRKVSHHCIWSLASCFL
ncbi:unnamed protein product [Protopolystoma xenopodis]|uniref:Phorbol-ester/DAG-type domain-containing protein n=1 Tax=Protopolystoma xenopodis TaxID=117903 RepID=A0A448WE34_9PLAT|nr:unnamed protein product [Protopolystoma xenopodis]